MIRIFRLDPNPKGVEFLDRVTQGGVCASMAATFCCNELNNIHKPDCYYQHIYNFTATQRAYTESVSAELLFPHDFIRPCDGIAIDDADKLNHINQLRLTSPGTYILSINFRLSLTSTESLSHALAMVMRKGRWFFLDPNDGLFECNNGIAEFIHYLKSHYMIEKSFLFALKKTDRFPVKNKVVPRFWGNSDARFAFLTGRNHPTINPGRPPAPRPRATTVQPVPRPRRKPLS